MTEIIIAVAAKVSEYLVAPIGRQLSYLFCYGGHMDDLNKKVQELGLAKDDLQITVDEAIRRGDEIRPIVQDWLTRADKNTGEAKKFMEDEKKRTKSCFNGWCPNLKSRYLLSREAYEKAQVIDKVQEDRKFPDGVAYCVPLRNVTFKNYEPFESRASTVNKVMDALRADEINKIGVWGMGGVGKTTLVKQVSQLAEDEKLFITRVYVDVSWTRDSEKLQDGIAKIQQKIADMLGLEFKGKDESTRAAELKQRLQKEKILIILDDIWKEVSLEEVGIPSKDDQKGCKIVMASRNEDLLRKDMGAKECFPLQHLPEKEAWNLFKKTAGDSVEGDKLQHIAIEVVNECGGLPIAIVTIANALKGECVAIWENALDELRSAAPTNISGVDDKVYGCLKWSYDHLKGDEVKSLFLLCGWLSYGDISMHQLLQYAMGLDLFDHINSLEKARNKLVTLVRTLKASSLLLDGEDHRNGIGGASRLLFMDADNKSVRMHDVVRDVARNIASKDPHRFVVREHDEEWSKTDGSKYISLNCEDVHELPHRLVCPELQFLLLQNISPTLNIPHTFFEGMNLLKVLDLSEMHFTTLPSTLHSLPNLRTLRLDRCKLGDIALIGELKKLQVLSMVGSDIQQLPSEMGQLTNLRLLDLNDCWELDVIPRNILSSLSRLECLCMQRSFTQWAAEGVSDGESNACLSELNHLRHLTTIEIQVPAVELLPKEDMFFENLTRYAIFDGSFYSWERKYKTSKQLKLRQVDLLLRDGIGKLLKKTEDLELSNLEEVCRGPIPPRSLDNLKTLHVEECHGLKFLFLLSRGLSQLEEMTIKHCNAMQQIITWEGEFEIKEVDHVGTDLQLLPKLRVLKLRDLPELMNFDYFGSNLETASQGMCSQGNPDIHMPFFSYQVSFPNLEKLILHYLPKLREIWHHQLPLGSFNNLKILKVQNCQGLFNLIPSHLIQRFDNLKELEVNNCEVLKHVFDLQGLDRNIRILPRLESLKLNVLPKLRRVVCNEDENKNDSVRCLFSSSTAFQNLKFLSIKYCGYKVEDEEHISTPKEDVVLFDGKVSFPNLENLILHYLPKLREIWHHQHPPESFYNLQILEVYNCPSLLNLIPSHLIQRFDNMKKLGVDNCEVLKHVFDLQGLDGNIRILPRLESLELNELPKLRRVVCNEDDDKNDSVRCRFSSSTAFHNLKFLSITNCGNQVEDEGHINTPMEDVVLFDGKVSFPNLEELTLIGLYKLKMISHHQLSLESVCRLHCPHLLSFSKFKDFHHLKKLSILNCGMLLHEKVSFPPNLEELVLKSLPKLKEMDVGIVLKLKILKLKKLPRLRLTFASMFKNFHNLRELHIIDCGMEDGEDVNTPTNDVVVSNEKVSFPPNLEELVLKGLPKLTEIDVGILPKLKILKLEELHLCKVLFPLNMKEIDFGILPKLEILKLEKLPQLRHVIKRWVLSPSMFKNFHNLKELRIIDYGMEDERSINTSTNNEVLSNEKASFLESRASTLNKIMDALRDHNINLIGVWGMAGVGKTTLLEQVAQQAKQQRLFTKQAYMDLSSIPDSEKLRQRIARALGLRRRKPNADELKQALKEEKILIILDDIQREVDLEQVGIPSKDDIWTQCKIVLASRDGDLLCKGMGAQICFPVEYLPLEEAWSLFKKTTGDSVEENLELRPIAIQVVEECEGLPIAIVTIAKALKDETVAVWKNAVEKLRSCAPTNIRAVGKNVYSYLEWSYTHLKGDDVKSLFLLCGMLGYGDISLDLLLQYGMGLDLFDRIDSLEQARNRLLELVKILKASGLLLDSRKNRDKFVRMHDVVCDVVREIASKDPHPFVVREDVGLEEWSETDESKSCTFISLHCKAVHELPQGLVCPDLQFFQLLNNNPSLNIPNTFFEGMKKLKVLDLSKMCFTMLPSSLDSLTNLQTLRLDGCKLEDIALIGKLTKLEVLSLMGSTIQQLPNEMVQLTNLRLLDLNDCKELEVIPRNILSSLSRLECLYMISSFTQWVVEGESNACLSELNNLPHLTTLEINIPNAKLLPKDILFENLTRYGIFIGGSWGLRTKRALKLYEVNRSLHLGDGMSKLLEKSEELQFWKLSGTKYVLHQSNRESFLELKHLEVNYSPEIQYIIDSKNQRFLQHDVFPLLESLKLHILKKLEGVWHGPIPMESFGNLKTLNVDSCHKLKFLLLQSTARGLPQLEEMTIEDCDAMQQIIAYERESEKQEDGHVGTNLQLFPKLRSLKLKSLPQLINFSSQLETTSSTSLSTNARSKDSFFSHKVSFPKLEELTLKNLPKLKDIWHHQLPFESFSNLRILRVYKCP